MLGFGAAVAGGALGGMLCDIDCKGTDRNRETITGAIIAAVCIAAVAVFDIIAGNGIIAYIRRTFGLELIIGCICLILCCIWGCRSPHRTFTHSLTGLVLMSGSIWLICAPLGIAVGIGMVSHILLDLCNRRRIPLLYPMRKPAVCFRLCDADGTVNSVLCVLFTLLAAVLILDRGSLVILHIDLIALVRGVLGF